MTPLPTYTPPVKFGVVIGWTLIAIVMFNVLFGIGVWADEWMAGLAGWLE